MLRCLRGASLALCLAFASYGQTVRAEEAPAGVKTAFNEMRAAFETKSVKRLMATGASDFKIKTKQGVEDRKSVETEMKGFFAMIVGKPKVNVKIIDCRVKGDTAVVGTAMTMSFKIKTPDGKIHTMETKSHSEDTLVRTSKGWKFKFIETKQEQAKMDGQPIDLSQMSGVGSQ